MLVRNRLKLVVVAVLGAALMVICTPRSIPSDDAEVDSLSVRVFLPHVAPKQWSNHEIVLVLSLPLAVDDRLNESPLVVSQIDTATEPVAELLARHRDRKALHPTAPEEVTITVAPMVPDDRVFDVRGGPLGMESHLRDVTVRRGKPTAQYVLVRPSWVKCGIQLIVARDGIVIWRSGKIDLLTGEESAATQPSTQK